MTLAMKRLYWIMAVAGFAGTLAFILGPFFLSGSLDFGFPAGLSNFEFILRHYLLALVFFALITVALSVVRRAEDAHSIGKSFAFSLLGFSLGSWLASVLFLLAIGLAFSRAAPLW